MSRLHLEDPSTLFVQRPQGPGTKLATPSSAKPAGSGIIWHVLNKEKLERVLQRMGAQPLDGIGSQSRLGVLKDDDGTTSGIKSLYKEVRTLNILLTDIHKAVTAGPTGHTGQLDGSVTVTPPGHRAYHSRRSSLPVSPTTTFPKVFSLKDINLLLSYIIHLFHLLKVVLSRSILFMIRLVVAWLDDMLYPN
ncbi:hypothetical protein NLI96_g10635 [Meripilus lineatus]|uniref:Uncharacterized protein n=1 Tax=Meripilus lineatus TaxID=2056292 RepID=A0AAD5Y9X6_9APHY|nr:hypothetical protein NLI96_g10635 [Physisporinus lineatus]